MMSTGEEARVGQQRLQARRRKFTRLVAVGAVAFMVIGGVTGFMTAMAEETAFPAWPVILLLIAAVIGLVVFSAMYFRRIDEVDLADNLWASLIGLYFYGAAFPSWVLLHTLGFLPPVDGWTLWGATMIVALIAYVARRARLR